MSRVVHFELGVDDPARALAFYEKTFGWKATQWGDMDYWLIKTGEEGEGGIDGAIQPRRQGMPPIVNTLSITSLEDTIAAVQANGGKVLEPRMVVPGLGYMGYCLDTEGNPFGVMQSDPNAKPE